MKRAISTQSTGGEGWGPSPEDGRVAGVGEDGSGKGGRGGGEVPIRKVGASVNYSKNHSHVHLHTGCIQTCV